MGQRIFAENLQRNGILVEDSLSARWSPYQIAVVCRNSRVREIKALMQPYLDSMPGHIDFARDYACEQPGFTKILVQISCAVPGRARLATLVARLDLEKNLSQISWTGLPAGTVAH